jgi:UDP-N-acetylenolpyruvoylglucosamine reductase
MLEKKDCEFSYRNSIFKNSNLIVVSAIFNFPKMSKEESNKAKEDRIELCKKVQDNSAPNFGTTFMEYNLKIMKLAKIMGIGNSAVHFSKKTSNWLLNCNNGNYKDATSAIKKIEKWHKIFGKKCKLEVIVWE